MAGLKIDCSKEIYLLKWPQVKRDILDPFTFKTDNISSALNGIKIIFGIKIKRLKILLQIKCLMK